MPVVVLGLSLVVLAVSGLTSRAATDVDYSGFLDKVAAGQVRAVQIGSDGHLSG